MITTVNVTTSAAQIVAASHSRKLLVIQNVSDTDVYLKFDSSATEVTTANGFKLAAGDPPLIVTCEPGEFPYAVRAIHGGSGNKDCRIQEEYAV